MVNFLLSAYFDGHFCYHSNGKSQIDLRLLHNLVIVLLNLLVQIGEKQFLYFSLIGGPKSLIMHVAQSLGPDKNINKINPNR